MSTTTTHPFALGWDPYRAEDAYAQLKSQHRLWTVVQGPYPEAVSLTKARLRHLEQGQAGTCWAHSAVQNAEVFGNAHGYSSFPICRRLVGWQGKQLEGGGNPSNGGAVVDGLLAMSSSKGAGIAHEDLCPYSDDYRTLDTKPPDNVFADGKKANLVAVIDVQSDEDARKLISANIPVSNGIWWPYGWDGGTTFHDTVGNGTYGHALLEIGYVMPGVFDQYAWFQLDNWHGLLYPALTPEKAAKVPGYQPIGDKTSDFWVRADVYERVRNMGNAERIAATDLVGLGTIVTNDHFGSDWGLI